MAGHFAELSQLRADDVGGAALRAAARAFPFEVHLGGDEAFDRVGHVGEPGAAAHFAVGVDVEADGALLAERGEDGAVFDGAQFLFGDFAFGVGGASGQQLRGTQQAADVLGAIRRVHAFMIFAERLEAGNCGGRLGGFWGRRGCLWGGTAHRVPVLLLRFA